MSNSNSKIVQDRITIRSTKHQDSVKATKLIYMTGEIPQNSYVKTECKYICTNHVYFSA